MCLTSGAHIDQDREEGEAEFFFLLAKRFGPFRVDLAFAVGDKNNIALLETRLAQTVQCRVERFLKISAAAGKIFGQIHDGLSLDFIAVSRIHVEDLQWSVGRGETDRAE